MNGRVVAVAHTGVTVSDMARAITFFGEVLGARIEAPILHTDPLFEQVTGVPGAEIEIAYADLQGHVIELLCYRKPVDRVTSTSRPCDPGHMHLSLKVAGIDALLKRMTAYGFEPVGPVVDAREAGFRVIYTCGFDNLIIELMDFGSASG